MIKKLLFRRLDLLILELFFLLFSVQTFGQSPNVTRIHTDWGPTNYWTANGATGVGNRPDTENNLLGFLWNGTTYSTGVNDATLTSKVAGVNIQKFRALKIQSLSYTSSTYFLQGSMLDGSSSGRVLTPPLASSASTPAELASRLTDGINGLSLGTGVANIATNSVYFKVGTGNLNLLGLNDGIPDLIVTQVAQPGGADIFKFVDASGNLVGNVISVDFGSVPVVGSYSLDLFNASNGTIASGFSAGENRDIRILGYDTSAFGINSSNAAQVDRFVVGFSGNSDCAFIAFNANSLKKAELSLVKKGTISGCGIAGNSINYTFDVTNTGDVTITNVVVTDPLSGLVISGTQGSTLAVGATAHLTGTYTITAADVLAGKITNSAKVTGIDPSLNTVEDISGDAINNDIATVTNLLTAPTGITGTTAICNGSSTTLTATGGTVIGTGATVEWFTGSCGGTAIGTGNSITVSPNSNTTYYVRYRNNCKVTSCVSQLVSVNPTPTLSGSAQPIFACDGSAATINLTGLLANTTSTITYTINGGSTQTVIGVLADGSGLGSFTTGVLTSANDGKILRITGVTTTSSTPGCAKSFAIDLPLKVKPDSGAISLNGGSPVASGGNTTFSELSNVTFSIDPISGATGYTWSFPAGWTVLSGAGTNAVTVKTGTYQQSGNVTVRVNNVLCPTSITVALSSIAPPAPTASVTANVTCAALGIVELSNLPVVGNWSIYKIKNTVSSLVVANTSGSTYTVNNLAAGDYTFTVTNTHGTSNPSSSITINDLVTNIWNGTSWSKGSAPTADDIVVFAGPATIASSLTGCSCQVNAGVNVVVKSGIVLKLINGLDILGSGAAAGTLTFENGASLVQVNNVANTGNIKYIRTTSPVQNFDYVYWCSPVKDQKLYDFSPNSDKYYSYALGAWVAESGNAKMSPEGKGFIIRVPKLNTNTPQTFEFEGVPNNGDISVDVTDIKYNLIGNPYPSAIQADKFIQDPDNYDNGGYLYFWTHNTQRQLAGSKYIYAVDDYAFCNAFGGTAAGSTGVDNNGNPIGIPPSNEIGAGQGFFVANDYVGKLHFKNSMRNDILNRNNQFFKQTGTKKSAKIEKSRIWLNLTNDRGAFKQLLVGYATGATNGFDKFYDGASINSNAFIDFYSVNDSKDYTIQGRGWPFDVSDEVPLGYKTTIAGSFKININDVDGTLTQQAIYLEDKVTNTIHNLKTGPYTFTTEIGVFRRRFVLRYTDNAKLGTDDNQINGKGVIVSVKNRQIKVNSFDQNIVGVKVYDLKGSLIYEKDKLTSNEFLVDHLSSGDQFMIVMVQLEDGKWVSKEIIFR